MTADTVVRLLSGKHSTYPEIGAPGGRVVELRRARDFDEGRSNNTHSLGNWTK